MDYHHSVTIEVEVAPPVVHRDGDTFILLTVLDQNTQEIKYVVGRKYFFPPGVYRMVGGGLDPDEDDQRDPESELREEVRLSPGSYELVPLGQVTLRVRELTPPDDDDDDYEYPEMREHTFVSDIVMYHAGTQELRAHDDMDELVALTESEFRDLINTLEDQDNGHDEDIGASWRDWGKVYARIHEIALEASKNVELTPA